MDGYAVELTTLDGRTIVGKALALEVRPEEFFVVLHDDGTTEDIRVDRIRYMAVLTRPCRFDDHTFAILDTAPDTKVSPTPSSNR
jgi:hypothetical protein